MPKAFCHWSSKFGCVLQEFLIFIRCLVRIPMFGGIFVFQGLIMEHYNDILASIPGQFRTEFEHYLSSGSASLLLNFSPWSFGVPTTASISL